MMRRFRGWAAAAVCFSACGGTPEGIPAPEGAPCPCVMEQFCCPNTQSCALSPARCPAGLRLDALEPAAGARAGEFPLRLVGEGLTSDVSVFVAGRPCPPLEPGPGSDSQGSFAGTERVCLVPPGPPEGGMVEVRVEKAGLRVTRPFRYEVPSFVERATEWDIRNLVTDGGVSMFRMGPDQPMLLFFGALPGNRQREDGFFVDNRRPWVFRPAGQGRFERWTELPQVSAPLSMVAADLDQNGASELVASAQRWPTPPGAASILRWDGPELDAWSIDELNFLPATHVLPMDLDGDRDLDLIACAFFAPIPPAVQLWFQVTPGQFNPRAAVSLDSLLSCNSLQVTDLDGDLVPEFVAVHGNGLRVFQKDGENWTEQTDQLFSDDDEELPFILRSVAAVDWDGDGDLDLAAASPSPVDLAGDGDQMDQARGIVLWENREDFNGNRRFERLGPLQRAGSSQPNCPLDPDPDPQVSLPWGTGDVLWFDVDLDGDVDAWLPASSPWCAFGPGLYLNGVDEGLDGFVWVDTPSDGILLDSIGGAAGDWDGDGDLDVMHNSRFDGARSVFENTFRDRVSAGAHFLTVLPISDPDGDATDSDLSDDRIEPSLVVQLSRQGPRFRAGQDPFQVQATGGVRGTLSHGPMEAHFGLGAHGGPVWVRTRFPDGSVVTQRVDRVDGRVELRDCREERCSL